MQRHPFIADGTDDRLAVRRTEAAFDFAPRRARRWRGCDRAFRQFFSRSFFGDRRSNGKPFRG